MYFFYKTPMKIAKMNDNDDFVKFLLKDQRLNDESRNI